MKGSLNQGMRDGPWTYYYTNGAKEAEGHYSNDVQEGEWVYYYKTGERWKKGSFKEGKKQGNWTTWWENGNKLQEGVYENNIEQGVWTSWWQNAQLKDRGRLDGHKLIGAWEGWHENSKLYYKGTYSSDGQKEGEWTYYTKQGKPDELITYSKGIKDGVYTKWNTRGGTIESNGSYKNGLKHSTWIYFYETGVLRARQNFTNGKLNGLSENFHENAKPQSACHYSLIPDKAGVLQSVPNGEWVFWDQKGNIVNTFHYVKGIRK
jgi:antitoxin component YwqK of YwqJK toxin-antitoxin module